MPAFKPFENDTQVITFPCGDDEFSIENGIEALVVSGTLTLVKGDETATSTLRALILELTKVLAALG